MTYCPLSRTNHSVAADSNFIWIEQAKITLHSEETPWLQNKHEGLRVFWHITIEEVT